MGEHGGVAGSARRPILPVAGRSELDPTRSLAKEAALVTRAVLRWTSMQIGMRNTFDHRSCTQLGLSYA
jgi:hypothetical protein